MFPALVCVRSSTEDLLSLLSLTLTDMFVRDSSTCITESLSFKKYFA
jgi:hypothetical protein